MSSKKIVILACLLLLIIGIPLAYFLGERNSSNNDNGAVGIVNEKTLYQNELTPQEHQNLFDATTQYYMAIENILARRYFDSVIAKYKQEHDLPSELDAQKAYIDEHTTITDAQIADFIEANKDNPQLKGKSVDEQKQLVGPYLRQQAIQNFLEGLVVKATADGDIKVLMVKKPKLPIVDIIINDDDPSIGPKNALVTIVEFADYQCPFCQKEFSIVQAILNKYKDQVRFVFKNYPLTQIHEQAVNAAIAAECARRQNKFWEMHEKLFENSGRLSDKLYPELAQSLNLVMPQFEQCFKDSAVQEKIISEIEYAQALGITSTPAFYINGNLLMGAQPLSVLEGAIDEALQKNRLNR